MPRAKTTYIRLILLDFMKMNGAQITRHLPHLGPRGNTGGSTTSHHWLQLIGFCLFLLALPATSKASTTINQQVDQAIHQHLSALMHPSAQRENWQGMRITHTSTPLGSTRTLATCSQAPAVSGGAADNYRQRLTITCPDQPGWRMQVATEMQVWLPVLVATRVIDRGQVISAADVKSQEIDIGKAPRGFYHHAKQVTGMSAKRRIRANQVLSPGLIALPLAVKRGDKVKIVATQDGISASMSGEAISNAAEGDVIRVKNLSSGKTIDAKVIAPGVVTSIF